MKNIKALLALGLALGLAGGCAEPARTKIAMPPLAESPSPQTIFGEATLTSAGNPKAPLEVPQAPPGRTMSLDDCLAIAQKVSPSIDSADQGRIGAMWSRWQAITAFLPSASASYGITHVDNVRDNSMGLAANSRDGHTMNFQVSQAVFAGGANVTNYMLSQLGVDASEIQRIQAREDLVLTVKQVYYQVLALEKALEVAKTSVVNLKSHLGVAQNFYDVGMVPKNQVLEAEVELAKAVQAETATSHDLVTAKTNLNILLRRDLNTPVKIVDLLRYNNFPMSMERCIDISLAERPEMNLGRNQVESSAKGIDLARAGYFPTVGVTYNNQTVGGGANRTGNTNLSDPSSWNVQALATFNFWEWGNTKAGVEKSKVALNQAVNTLTSLEDSTKLDVTTNYQKLLSAGKNIGVAQKAVVAAAEDLRMVTERYQEQVATNTDVLDSQTRYNEAQYEYYQALYNYNLAWATLERSLGRRVPPGDGAKSAKAETAEAAAAN